MHPNRSAAAHSGKRRTKSISIHQQQTPKAGVVSPTPQPVLAYGNFTQSGTWTQIGASAKHDISGVHNTVFSVLDEVSPSPPSEVGCAMDAGANLGCSGDLYGNAYATPFPAPVDSNPNPNPTPTTYPTQYAGPAVIAQATSPPTPQPGNVLINGTLAALSHNACMSPSTSPVSSGVPCEFTWAIPSFSMGIGTTTVVVPVSSVCTVTATQSPIVASGDVMTVWVTLSDTILTVHAQDLQSSAMGTFGGIGNCN
jgi:hypothetical protein